MIAGIICEYNPFHNGHLYQIKRTREKGADYIVCVMSGNFVQRGDCAYFDKWTRARAAVLCGADIVIDLPVPWALGSAENFARGAVGLLCDFRIDALSFGSEFEDESLLRKCAEISETEQVGKEVKRLAAQGMSYPSALCSAVKEICGEEASKLFSSPNSTLAIEYIKALNKLSPETKIIPVLRKGVAHDSDSASDCFASASKIRSLNDFSSARSFMPEKAFEIFHNSVEQGFGGCNVKNAEIAVISSLREMNKADFKKYVTDESGLADRLYDSVKEAENLNELYDRAKSKNYTHARVRREVMSLYLKIEKELGKDKAPYMKILAASSRGMALLAHAKRNSSVPVITRHSETRQLEGTAKKIYELQCASTDKFALFSKKIRPCSMEQTNSIIIADE